ATVAEIKGRSVMAQVLKNHIANYERVPDHDEQLRVGSHTIVLRRKDVRTARDRARRSGDAHNAARNGFVTGLLKILAEDLAREMGLDSAGERLPELLEELRSSIDVRRALNLAWFPISPAGALRALLGKPHKLRDAAARLLSPAERASLHEDRREEFTIDDVPLLDELAELLGTAPQQTQARDEAAREYAEAVVDMTETGGMVSAEMLADRWEEQGPSMTLAERALEDREWTYGHLVVDEAQELTPMQWRGRLRRGAAKPATAGGAPAPPPSGRTRPPRTPSPPQSVMNLANRYLPRHSPQLELVESVRQGGTDPQLDTFASETETLNALAEVTTAEIAAAETGKIAVVADESLIEAIAEVLADFDFGRSVRGLDHQVALIN